MPYTLDIIMKTHGYTTYTLKSQELCGEVFNVISLTDFNFVLIL